MIHSEVMRERIIKKASSSLVAIFSLAFLLIFIAAMRNPQLSSDDSKKSYSYLALGDSYTIGEQVQPADNFPNQAVQKLREKGFDVKSPVIIAKTGWTTDELQGAITKARLRKKYDFVTLLIGVNNQYRGQQVVDYIPQLESLVSQAIRFTGNDTSNVIVISIPDWSVTPFAEGRDRKQIAAEIDEYNAANKLVAQKFNVHYINITDGSRKAAQDASLLTGDGLHPSGKEYGRWADDVANFIKEVL